MADKEKPNTTGTKEYVFDPNEHLMQLKSQQGPKDYLPVQWRLVWFRDEHPEGSVETEMLLLDLDKELEKEAFAFNQTTKRSEKVLKKAKGIAVFRAVVKDSKGGIGTGHGSESAADFDDFIEKAETKALGRALATLGYGTQFTGEEFDEKHRIVDAPVDRGEGDSPGPEPVPVPGPVHPTAQTTPQPKPPTVAVQKPATQPTPAPVAPVPVVEEAKQKSDAEGPGEAQVIAVDADTDMIPEKARFIIAELERELGTFEIKRFQLLLGLKAEDNIYDAIHWQGLTGEELMGRAMETLTKWLKPHPKRTEWLAQPALAEQLAEIKNTLPEGEYSASNPRPASHYKQAFEDNPGSVQSFHMDILLGDDKRTVENIEKAHKNIVRQMLGIRDMDKTMHGKPFGSFTAGEADRFLMYCDPNRSTITDGVLQVEIPPEFQYKEQHSTNVAA